MIALGPPHRRPLEAIAAVVINVDPALPPPLRRKVAQDAMSQLVDWMEDQPFRLKAEKVGDYVRWTATPVESDQTRATQDAALAMWRGGLP